MLRSSVHRLGTVLIRRSCALALIVATSACTASAGRFTWIDQLPPEQKTSTKDSYALGVNDLISVQVFNHTEMSGRAKVRADGNVSVALIGDVIAAGKTPQELAREIEQQLGARNLVVAARVTVALEEAAPLRVSVIGEVARPGLYNLEPGAGLSEALASSGGLTDFAHRDRLFVLRRTPELVRIRFTFADLSRGNGGAPLFRLRSGDTIVVE